MHNTFLADARCAQGMCSVQFQFGTFWNLFPPCYSPHIFVSGSHGCIFNGHGHTHMYVRTFAQITRLLSLYSSTLHVATCTVAHPPSLNFSLTVLYSFPNIQYCKLRVVPGIGKRIYTFYYLRHLPLVAYGFLKMKGTSLLKVMP